MDADNVINHVAKFSTERGALASNKELTIRNEAEQSVERQVIKKYIITIMDNKSCDTYDIEVKARSAEDAIMIADFNVCKKITDIDGRPTSRIYSITAE